MKPLEHVSENSEHATGFGGKTDIIKCPYFFDLPRFAMAMAIRNATFCRFLTPIDEQFKCGCTPFPEASLDALEWRRIDLSNGTSPTPGFSILLEKSIKQNGPFFAAEWLIYSYFWPLRSRKWPILFDGYLQEYAKPQSGTGAI